MGGSRPREVREALAEAGIPLTVDTMADGRLRFIYENPGERWYEEVISVIRPVQRLSVERWLDVARAIVEDIEFKINRGE